jgi:ABC-type nickel/cobalt efflux system permease component RcnA
MFTLTQWLQLAAVIILPCLAAWLVTKGTKSMVDRDIRRYREVDKVLEEIGRMPD